MVWQPVLNVGGAEMCFADQGGRVAGILQMISQDRYRFAQVDVMVEDLVPSLAPSGDHAGAGGHTDGIGGVRPVETHTLIREPVHIGSTDRVIVQADSVPALLIGSDEQEVWSTAPRRNSSSRQEYLGDQPMSCVTFSVDRGA